MKASWMITAFAFAITIATYGPNGPPTGCTALSIPNVFTNAISGVEISNLIEGVLPSEGREATLVNAIGTAVGANLTVVSENAISSLSGPMRSLSVTMVNLLRSILSGIEIPIKRWIGSAQETLDRIEASFRGLNVINGDTTKITRRRRHLESTIEDLCDHWIKQVKLLIEQFQEILINAEKQVTNTPELLENTLALFPQIIAHPVENLSNFLNFLRLLPLDLGPLRQQIFSILVTFFTTQALPLLHTTLNRLAETNLLPPSFNAFIQSFNNVYNLLRLFKYIP